MAARPGSQHLDEHSTEELRRRAVRGSAASLTAQGFSLMIGMISQVVLARLLTPSDFGLVAMVTAFTGLATLIRDFGLSTATVQKTHLSHEELSSLFWINAAFGACVTVGFAALSPLVAFFYGDDRLLWITLLLSVPCLLGGLSTQHQALLRREMRFIKLGAIDVLSLVASTSAAILAALHGGRHWSLVLGNLTGAAVTLVAVWTACDWRPGAPSWRARPRSALTFGGYVTAFNVSNYFARNLDNALIGWYWNERLLGLYSKAYSLLLLPLQQVNAPIAAVAIPSLSRLQDDPKRFRAAYLKVLSLTTFLTVPLVGILALVPGPIIEVVLGRAWQPSAPIFRFLSLAAFPQVVLNTTGWLLIAGGRPDRLFRWSIFATPVIVGSFLVGLSGGPDTVAAAYAAVSFLLFVPCLFYVTKGTPVSPRDIIGAVWRQFTSAGVAAGASLLLLEGGLGSWSAAAQLASIAGVFSACYLVVMLGAFGTAKFYWSLRHDLRPDSAR